MLTIGELKGLEETGGSGIAFMGRNGYMVLRFQNKMIKPGLTKIEKWYDSERIKTLAFAVEYLMAVRK